MKQIDNKKLCIKSYVKGCERYGRNMERNKRI